MKKILIFDMDGTLLDSMGMWRFLLDTLEKNIHAIHNLEPMDAKTDSMIDYSYKLVKDKYPDIDKKLIYRYFHEHFTEFYSQNNLTKKSVKEKLEKFYNEGYEMYVATATDFHYANIGIKSNGLSKYIKKIYTQDNLNYKKKDIEYFEALVDSMKVNPKDVIYFDDAKHANKHAKHIGFTTVAVFDEHAQEMEENKLISDYYIEFFSEINDDMIK